MTDVDQNAKKKLCDLRVIDLRYELEKRGLDRTGVKPALVERLTKAIEDEGQNPDEFLFDIIVEKTTKPPVKRSSRKMKEDETEVVNEEEDEEEDKHVEKKEEKKMEKPEEEKVEKQEEEKMEKQEEKKMEKQEIKIDEEKQEKNEVPMLEKSEEKQVEKPEVNAVEKSEEKQDDHVDNKEKKENEEEETKELNKKDAVEKEENNANEEEAQCNGNDIETLKDSLMNAGHLSPPKPETSPVIAPLTVEDVIKLDTSSKIKASDNDSLIVNPDDTQSDMDSSINENQSVDEPMHEDTEDQSNCNSVPDNADESQVNNEDKPSTKDSNSDVKATEDKTISSEENIPTTDQTSDSTTATTKRKSLEEDKSTTEGDNVKRVSASGKNLWVSGLAEKTRANDLKSLFSKYGKVSTAKIVTNAKTPGARCYGFITMAISEEAAVCIEKLNRTELHGRIITVEKTTREPTGSIKRTELKAIQNKAAQKKTETKKSDDKKESSDSTKSKDAKTPDKRAEKTRSTEKSRSDRVKSVEKSDKKDDEKKEVKKRTPSKERAHKIRDRSRERRRRERRTRTRSRSRERFRGGRGGGGNFFRGGFNRGDFGGRRPFGNSRNFEDRFRDRERSRERDRRFSDVVRQREIERQNREESIRLERERERLRVEREKLERERAEVLRLEREKQRLERERLEREKAELRKRTQMTLEERRGIKRSFDGPLKEADPFWDDRKRHSNPRRDSPVEPITRTCHFVLGLISSTPEGATALSEFGWEAVKRNHEEKWPLIKEELFFDTTKVRKSTWSFSSMSYDFPLGALPTNLSFVVRHSPYSFSDSRNSSYSSLDALPNSLDRKHFSGVTSHRKDSNDHDSSSDDGRPRSSSDCQSDPKERIMFQIAESSSWDTLDTCYSASPPGFNPHRKRRSISTSEVEMKGFDFKFQNNQEKHDEIDENEESSPSFKSSFPMVSVSNANTQSSSDLHANASDSSYNISSKSSDVGVDRPSLLKQLSRGQSIHLHSPESPEKTPFLLTSARDALGYATLKDIQRRRVSSLSFHDPSLSSIDYSVRHMKTKSLDADGAKIFNVAPNDLFFSEMEENSVRQRFSSQEEKKDPDIHYIGISLPSNLSSLFDVPKSLTSDDSEFQTPEGSQNPSPSDVFEFHSEENCLLNHAFNDKKSLQSTTIDEESEDNQTTQVKSTSENVSKKPVILDRSNSIRSFFKCKDETVNSQYLIRKEAMRYVTNLCSSVAVKASEQGLLNLKQKFPTAFQDVCLYSEICDYISNYNFRLTARRFLQELFLDVTFEQLQWEAEAIVSIISIPQVSGSEI